MPHLNLISIVVHDYDAAIDFFCRVLDFDLIEDSPDTSTDSGKPKRWVVVRPKGGETTTKTGIVLAKAADEAQTAVVGNQTGGRVGFFLTVDDFAASHRRMIEAGVKFLSEPRHEPYGTVAVFVDICGNKWDLLGP